MPVLVNELFSVVFNCFLYIVIFLVQTVRSNFHNDKGCSLHCQMLLLSDALMPLLHFLELSQKHRQETMLTIVTKIRPFVPFLLLKIKAYMA